MWPHRNSSTGYLKNFPNTMLVNMSLQETSLNISTPIGGAWSRDFETNAFLANYFDVASAPADYSDPSKWPTAIAGPGTVGGYTFPTGQPWYEAACFDSGFDLVARIRVMIRPWSKSSEYVSAKSGGAASWKLSTPEGIPYTDQQVLDFPGWADSSGTYGPDYDFLTQYPQGRN